MNYTFIGTTFLLQNSRVRMVTYLPICLKLYPINVPIVPTDIQLMTMSIECVRYCTNMETSGRAIAGMSTTIPTPPIITADLKAIVSFRI